ncbi:hypothetical protein [Microbacterium algeriense]|uniref:hypothetical protein n=1 Tax=Microbacterium algeriense TaxID=2615184 RepID=UPI0022E346E6|nr:hypothetical protein [Microbacterium algeriense]
MAITSLHVARMTAGVALAASAVALSGCTAFATSYDVLDREAEPADMVPDSVVAEDSGDVADLSSARLVGEHEGTSIWLLRGVEVGAVCVLAYPDNDLWLMACGGEQGPVELSGPAGHFVTVPDDYPTPDGATRISANVYAVTP